MPRAKCSPIPRAGPRVALYRLSVDYRVGCRRRSIGELSLRLQPLSIDGASVGHPARFPATSLKFRTAVFPGYGFKRLFHPESASASRGLKAPAYPPPLPRGGSDLRVSLQGRGPRAEALATTARTMSHPPVLASPRGLLSPRSSVRRPDLPGLAPPPDFAVYAYTGSPALRGSHQASHLLLMRDWLRGRMGSGHGRTNSDWISEVTGCTPIRANLSCGIALIPPFSRPFMQMPFPPLRGLPVSEIHPTFDDLTEVTPDHLSIAPDSGNDPFGGDIRRGKKPVRDSEPNPPTAPRGFLLASMSARGPGRTPVTDRNAGGF